MIMQSKKQSFIIMSVMILLCAAMYVVDVYITPAYFIKSLYKLFLFGIIPGVYYVFNKGNINNLFKFKGKNQLLSSLLIGLIVYFLIISTYLLIKDFIDLNQVEAQLAENLKVTKNNFIWVSLYISLINSLLEEFFFRGFGFLTLKKSAKPVQAYIFSSILFSLYHIAILANWFNPLLFLLIIIGLFITGIFFNWINEKTDNIYNSWFIHMFANFAINTVGFIMFGIV